MRTTGEEQGLASSRRLAFPLVSSDIDQRRLAAATTEHQKALGAFYTPPRLARTLAAWAIRSAEDRVLDPAAGEAVFLASAVDRLRSLGTCKTREKVTGVEIDPDARAKAEALLAGAGTPCPVHLGNFFELSPQDIGGHFEAVIGNPPYIRYHRFRGEARRRGLEAAAAAGVHLNGLASSWAPFVVHAAQFIAPGGRLALVLPAELLHVDYAGPVREFLLRRFASVTVITFEQAVFPGAMIDTVLLLAEEAGSLRGLRVIALGDVSDLERSLEGEFATEPVARWSRLRAPGAGADVVERLCEEERITSLSSVASVDIGCVTGANDFFVLTLHDIHKRELSPRAFEPVIARPANLKGAILTTSDVRSLTSTEHSLLLRLHRPGLEEAASPLGRYLRRGRRLGIPQRYKCRVRHPWYSVPGVRVPDAFLSYMSHRVPRIALNKGGLSSTNLVHQITFKPSERRWAAAYVAALHSSLALLSFEIEGRSYGGGVLKLETREAERAKVPVLSPSLAAALTTTLPKVDRTIREDGSNHAAYIVDRVLIAHGVLNESALRDVRATRAALLDRRVMRGATSGRG